MRDLNIPEDIRSLVDASLESGNPLLLAVVSPEGAPVLSYRGSARIFGDHCIGLWMRNKGGNTLDAIRSNSAAALMYRSASIPFLQFQGQAEIVEDYERRSQIFENSPAIEREADPDRLGVAVLIRIERIEGVTGFENGKPNFLKIG